MVKGVKMKIQIITMRIYGYEADFPTDWINELNVLDATLLKKEDYAVLIIVAKA